MKFVAMKTRRAGGEPTPLDRAWDALYRRANDRLQARMKDHGIPEPDTYPVQDLVLVYRFPNEYKGRIKLPEQYQQAHDAPYSLGVLLSAGPEAFGILESHGVLPGDYVQFARFAGEEETSQRVNEAIWKSKEVGASEVEVASLTRKIRDEEMGKKKLLRLQAPLIHQSVDLQERLFGPCPTMQLVREVDAKNRVLHVIEPVIANVLEGEV